MLSNQIKTTRGINILCAALIVLLFVLQCVPYWSFDETTIQVNVNQLDAPIVSDTAQPSREEFKLAATSDSINGVIWFPNHHEDVQNHFHLKAGDAFKASGSKLTDGKYTDGKLQTSWNIDPKNPTDNFSLSGLALAVGIQQIFAILFITALFFKLNSVSPAILSALHGAWGLIWFLIDPVLKLGNLYIVHIIICVVILVASVFSLSSGIISEKKKKASLVK